MGVNEGGYEGDFGAAMLFEGCGRGVANVCKKARVEGLICSLPDWKSTHVPGTHGMIIIGIPAYLNTPIYVQ